MDDSAGPGAVDAADTPAVSSAAHHEAAAKEEQPGGAVGATAAKPPGKLTGKLREPDPSSEDDYEGNIRKNKAASKKPLRCQVDGCGADLAQARKYFQRYRVCERHLKAPSLQMDGRSVRFCDQCSKFHDITMFEGSRRTCNEKLERTRQARSDKRRQLNEQAMRAQGRMRSRMYDMPDLKRPFGGAYSYDDYDDEDYEMEARGYMMPKRNRMLPPMGPAAAMHLASAAGMMPPLQDPLDAQGILALQRAAMMAGGLGGLPGGPCPPMLGVPGAHGGLHPNDGGASSLSSWDEGHPQAQLLRMESISSRPGAVSGLAAAAAAAGHGHFLLGNGAPPAAAYDPLRMQSPRGNGSTGAGSALARRALALGLGPPGLAGHDTAGAAALLADLYGITEGQAAAGLLGNGAGAASAASKLLGIDPRVAARAGVHPDALAAAAAGLGAPDPVGAIGGGNGGLASALLTPAERAELAALESRLQLGGGAGAAGGVGGRGRGVAGLGGEPLAGQALLQLQLAAAAAEAQAAGRGQAGAGGGGGPGAGLPLGGARLPRAEGTTGRLTPAEEELYESIVGTGTASALESDRLIHEGGATARMLRAAAAVAAAGGGGGSNGNGASRLLGAAGAGGVAAAAREVERLQAQEEALAAAELLLARLGGAGGSRGLGAGALAALRGGAGDDALDIAAAAARVASAGGGAGGGSALGSAARSSIPVLNLADEDAAASAGASAAALLLGGGGGGGPASAAASAMEEAAAAAWQLRRLQQQQQHQQQAHVQIRGGAAALDRQPPLGSLAPPSSSRYLYDDDDRSDVGLHDGRLPPLQPSSRGGERQALGSGPGSGSVSQMDQLSEIQDQLRLQILALAGRGTSARDQQLLLAQADRAAAAAAVAAGGGGSFPERELRGGGRGALPDSAGGVAAGTDPSGGGGGLGGSGQFGQRGAPPGSGSVSGRPERDGGGGGQFVHLRHLQEQLNQLGVQVVLQ